MSLLEKIYESKIKLDSSSKKFDLNDKDQLRDIIDPCVKWLVSKGAKLVTSWSGYCKNGRFQFFFQKKSRYSADIEILYDWGDNDLIFIKTVDVKGMSVEESKGTFLKELQKVYPTLNSKISSKVADIKDWEKALEDFVNSGTGPYYNTSKVAQNNKDRILSSLKSNGGDYYLSAMDEDDKVQKAIIDLGRFVTESSTWKKILRKTTKGLL